MRKHVEREEGLPNLMETDLYAVLDTNYLRELLNTEEWKGSRTKGLTYSILSS